MPPEGTFSTARGATRYEFAIAVARALENLDQASRSFQPLTPDPQVLLAITHLLSDFRPELEARFQIDVTARLAALAPKAALAPRADSAQDPVLAAGSFADVPAGHWAFAAVERLRLTGILIGYPDHGFSTENKHSR